jgi:hypothetical protein
LRQYKLPTWDQAWPQAFVPDNASAVYLRLFDNMYRWPGMVSGN